MSAWDRTMVYLGLKTVGTQEGYHRTGGAVRREVCERCGARVDPPEQQQHTDWHAEMGH